MENLDFLKLIFLSTSDIWFFWTNMECNAAVTLQFEDLAVKNYLFKKINIFVGEESQIVQLSTFDPCEMFLLKNVED